MRVRQIERGEPNDEFRIAVTLAAPDLAAELAEGSDAFDQAGHDIVQAFGPILASHSQAAASPDGITN